MLCDAVIQLISVEETSHRSVISLLHGRRIRGCERCLVELADDRLRRATRQEDGESGWRFKIRKPLLMSTGQIWQGRVYSRPRRRDFVEGVIFSRRDRWIRRRS